MARFEVIFIDCDQQFINNLIVRLNYSQFEPNKLL